MSHDSRQRYENPQMPRGEVRRPTAWGLTVAAALLVLALPAWRHADSGHGELLAELGDALAQARGESSALGANRALLRGMGRFEDRLEDGSPVFRTSLPSLQWGLTRFGGVGNETVYTGVPAGPEGWLLLRSGFDHLTGPPFLDSHLLERRRRHVRRRYGLC